MTTGFRRRRRSGTVVVTLTGFEADLLRSLASQLVELLRSEEAQPSSDDPLEAMFDFTGPTTEPDDPVLARLFPSAYRDDEEAAGEFRRFTEGSLRSAKATAAGTVIDALVEAGLPDQLPEEGQVEVEVELDLAAARTWMKVFTDVRLALATRLGVEEGDEEFWWTLPEDDPRSHVHDIYEWVGELQETLVRAVTA
ncbi:DUF2017 domain-containing protein [Nocardioidaceae bacterium]|nr:DUF2017 domain-containing protein [Nocardioidaceae bacterium]